MLPYAEGKAEWTYPQIKPADYAEFAKLSHIAASKYPSEAAASSPAKHEIKDALFRLTH
jgi:hypothetical protein